MIFLSNIEPFVQSTSLPECFKSKIFSYQILRADEPTERIGSMIGQTTRGVVSIDCIALDTIAVHPKP